MRPGKRRIARTRFNSASRSGRRFIGALWLKAGARTRRCASTCSLWVLRAGARASSAPAAGGSLRTTPRASAGASRFAAATAS